MAMTEITGAKLKSGRSTDFLKMQKKFWQLHLLILLPLAYIILFHYAPMYGVQIAFKKFRPSVGVWDSPWIGLKHFETLFRSYEFSRLIRNTLTLSFTNLIVGFPFPILLAIGINELLSKWYRKAVQLITYAPYFISTVVIIGIVNQLLDSRLGPLSMIIQNLGGQPVEWLKEPGAFVPIYVTTSIWQNAGYTAILYIAALTSIDLCLYEAAIMDGASKLQRIWYIDLPAIMPTAVTLLILSVGYVMNVGYDKALLLQNNFNIETSEIISVYVYKIGLVQNNPAFATAVGLFNSIVNVFLVVTVNKISKKVSGVSLW